MENPEHIEQSHGYGIYILVWLALLTLTAITVVVAGVDIGKFTIATALIIAAVKSYLVLTVFMHLKSESKVFRVFLAVALFFLLISFTLMFADYSFN